MYNLKDIHYYDNLKKIFNKEYSTITRKYINRPNIGTSTYLFQKYKPTSIEDFLYKYINDPSPIFDNNKCVGDLYYGRNIEQLNVLAYHLYNDIKSNDITQDMCLDIIINHSIIETYIGQKAEHYIINLIKQQNKFNAEQTYGFLDSQCGVDIIIKNKINNKPIFFLQIKPNTFLKNTIHNKQLILDKIELFNKQNNLNKYLNENNITTIYNNIFFLIYNAYQLKYNNKLLWLNINNKTKFTLNEIINNNGYTIINVDNNNNYKTITL